MKIFLKSTQSGNHPLTDISFPEKTKFLKVRNILFIIIFLKKTMQQTWIYIHIYCTYTKKKKKPGMTSRLRFYFIDTLADIECID